ncbi:LysM peptidoglycan-binding domain-containing protein [Phormidium sp. CLA17]|uniref:CIS tube protein n=1 Tax=Leptolyngbya sp. Cla-17 TaxID=2803751 RepID=UPI0014914EBC|nr:LysM peptidoglycan-binding domain-containing protein [Leptolyngbya sp. Cla-17]MBM0744169.1 LysM peptidoglycan-binding domain-containing protein [Leptolyngbya sp. Cla-17]
MALVKLVIAVEDKNHGFSTAIKVLYNPNQITITKTGWTTDAKIKKPFSKPSPATLSVNLFFDTSIPTDMAGSDTERFYKESFGINKYTYETVDVRNYVNQIFNLTNPRSELNRPPICRLIWGGKNEALSRLEGYKGTVMFQGVLQNVTKTFTRFSAEGIPVRANLSCTFLEYEDPVQNVKKLNPIDDPIRIIKQGESLSSIAQEEYGNSALWRIIADANRLVNPRQLTVGSLLTVPPLPR